MKRLKKAVTQYFKGRDLALENMSGGAVAAPDDFLELYVLVRLLQRAHHHISPQQVLNSGSHRYFVVAAAPSPNWNAASFFQCGASQHLGARTGLEVGAPHGGTCELDVLVIRRAQVTGTAVPASAVVAAADCKCLGGTLGNGDANEAIGKRSRLWVNGAGQAGAEAPIYFVVSATIASQNARVGLDSAGIGFCRHNGDELLTLLDQVVTSLDM